MQDLLNQLQDTDVLEEIEAINELITKLEAKELRAKCIKSGIAGFTKSQVNETGIDAYLDEIRKGIQAKLA
jgi:hypothetical protein